MATRYYYFMMSIRWSVYYFPIYYTKIIHHDCDIDMLCVMLSVSRCYFTRRVPMHRQTLHKKMRSTIYLSVSVVIHTLWSEFPCRRNHKTLVVNFFKNILLFYDLIWNQRDVHPHVLVPRNSGDSSSGTMPCDWFPRVGKMWGYGWWCYRVGFLCLNKFSAASAYPGISVFT